MYRTIEERKEKKEEEKSGRGAQAKLIEKRMYWIYSQFFAPFEYFEILFIVFICSSNIYLWFRTFIPFVRNGEKNLVWTEPFKWRFCALSECLRINF